MKEAFCRVSDEPFHISDVLVLLVPAAMGTKHAGSWNL
jgi:hypothetical protein